MLAPQRKRSRRASALRPRMLAPSPGVVHESELPRDAARCTNAHFGPGPAFTTLGGTTDVSAVPTPTANGQRAAAAYFSARSAGGWARSGTRHPFPRGPPPIAPGPPPPPVTRGGPPPRPPPPRP